LKEDDKESNLVRKRRRDRLRIPPLDFQMSQGRESSQIKWDNLNIQHMFWFRIVDLTRVNYSRNAQST
jgi:hypothetical protein